MAVSVAALAATGQFAVPTAVADDSTPAPVLQAQGNGGWAYDQGALPYSPGQWANVINDFNGTVTDPTHRLSKISSYGTDMEMYCPDNDGTQCTSDDLDVYYTPGGQGPRSTAAYAANVTGPFSVEPIIDGRIDNGYLQGFNELSRPLAEGYADKVAAQVCADENVMGIQFDNEPFDVSTQNGQYWFYLQIAKDFAGQHSSTEPNDPYGCVSEQHPQGRVFSVFTFARVLKPGTQSASNLTDIMTSYQNGYVIDSLYDLGDNPAGYLNDPKTYTNLVNAEAANMRDWANQAGVHYGFGIPATASAHEYTSCQGPCVAAPNGGTGYPMIDYVRPAIGAIHGAGAPQDPLYIGTDVWQYGSVTTIGSETMLPSTMSTDVVAYLAAHLPGPGSMEALVFNGRPKVTGHRVFGKVLTAHAPASTPAGAHLSYQWYRGTHQIKGATGRTYRTVKADVSKHLKVRVTGALPAWRSASVFSTQLSAIRSRPVVKATARVKDHGHWVILSLRVRAPGVGHVRGKASVFRHGHKLRAKAVRNGHAKIILHNLKHGRQRLTVRFHGTGASMSGTTHVVVRVH